MNALRFRDFHVVNSPWPRVGERVRLKRRYVPRRWWRAGAARTGTVLQDSRERGGVLVRHDQALQLWPPRQLMRYLRGEPGPVFAWAYHEVERV